MSVGQLQPLATQASRSEQVCAALRDALLSGLLAPGQQLSESQIARQLGVSKTPVREALSVLCGRGLLISSATRGYAVRAIDADMVRSLYEVREILEPEAVRRAVSNADSELIAQGRSLLSESHQSGERRDFNTLSRINRDFHELLYQRCGNSLMRRILDDMRDQLQFVAASGWHAAPSWEVERAEHEAILEAVEGRDAATAAKLTELHIERAAQTLAVLTGEPPGE